LLHVRMACHLVHVRMACHLLHVRMACHLVHVRVACHLVRMLVVHMRSRRRRVLVLNMNDLWKRSSPVASCDLF